MMMKKLSFKKLKNFLNFSKLKTSKRISLLSPAPMLALAAVLVGGTMAQESQQLQNTNPIDSKTVNVVNENRILEVNRGNQVSDVLLQKENEKVEQSTHVEREKNSVKKNIDSSSGSTSGKKNSISSSGVYMVNAYRKEDELLSSAQYKEILRTRAP
jgi:hypothetical protein